MLTDEEKKKQMQKQKHTHTHTQQTRNMGRMAARDSTCVHVVGGAPRVWVDDGAVPRVEQAQLVEGLGRARLPLCVPHGTHGTARHGTHSISIARSIARGIARSQQQTANEIQPKRQEAAANTHNRTQCMHATQASDMHFF